MLSKKINYDDYVNSINVLVRNLNKNKTYLNGIYRYHLFKILNKLYKMYLLDKITPIFARKIAFSLMTTNSTYLPPLNAIISISLFRSMFEISKHKLNSNEYIGVTIGCLSHFYSYSAFNTLLEMNLLSERTQLNSTIIFWNKHELFHLKNMIWNSAQHHNCSKQLISSIIFDEFGEILYRITRMLSNNESILERILPKFFYGCHIFFDISSNIDQTTNEDFRQSILNLWVKIRSKFPSIHKNARISIMDAIFHMR